MNLLKLIMVLSAPKKDDNYELGSFSEEAKHAWSDKHWEEELQKAFEAGRQMAV